MTPALTFFIGLVMLVLFGWYFATDQGPRKRLLAAILVVLLVTFSIVAIWPPKEKITLGLDIKGGTSFLIRLVPGEKPLSKAMLDQAVEVIRKRVDYFGTGEPIISPVGSDRILVQIPGLDTAKIQEARDQLSRVAKLEFRMVYPDNGQRLKAIDEGKEVIPPDYRIEVYKHPPEANEKPVEERLLVKKKADLGGNHVTQAAAGYGNEGWEVTLKFDSEGAKKFGEITEANVGHRFAIVLDGVIQSAPVIRTAIYGGNAVISGGHMDEREARALASVLENPLQTPVSIEEERSVSPTLGMDSIRVSVVAGLIGLALTLICVAIYYKFAGLVVNLALIVNLILLLGALSMLHLISSQHINFLGKGFLACMCSVALILAGATAFYIRGERNFGVDFRGGDLVRMSAPNKIDIGQVRHALSAIGFTDASIQESQQGGKSYITVRTPINTSEKVEKQIMQSMPSAGLTVEGSERVGALVGGELARSSLIALGLGILGILIYVTFRFELSFAVGATVALLHDVLITIGMFALLDRELSLPMVGAVLTIAGYSIYDTIVVYDRIREGLASGRKGSIEQIMNDSINQTLSRTLLTSGCTLIPICCLFFFGGAVLRDFALAIIIGVVVGTYSSIFIASPIVLWWTRARGRSTVALRREVTEKATTTASPLARR